jgi:hypothetical protein
MLECAKLEANCRIYQSDIGGMFMHRFPVFRLGKMTGHARKALGRAPLFKPNKFSDSKRQKPAK